MAPAGLDPKAEMEAAVGGRPSCARSERDMRNSMFDSELLEFLTNKMASLNVSDESDKRVRPNWLNGPTTNTEQNVFRGNSHNTTEYHLSPTDIAKNGDDLDPSLLYEDCRDNIDDEEFLDARDYLSPPATAEQEEHNGVVTVQRCPTLTIDDSASPSDSSSTESESIDGTPWMREVPYVPNRSFAETPLRCGQYKDFGADELESLREEVTLRQNSNVETEPEARVVVPVCYGVGDDVPDERQSQTEDSGLSAGDGQMGTSEQDEFCRAYAPTEDHISLVDATQLLLRRERCPIDSEVVTSDSAQDDGPYETYSSYTEDDDISQGHADLKITQRELPLAKAEGCTLDDFARVPGTAERCGFPTDDVLSVIDSIIMSKRRDSLRRTPVPQPAIKAEERLIEDVESISDSADDVELSTVTEAGISAAGEYQIRKEVLSDHESDELIDREDHATLSRSRTGQAFREICKYPKIEPRPLIINPTANIVGDIAEWCQFVDPSTGEEGFRDSLLDRRATLSIGGWHDVLVLRRFSDGPAGQSRALVQIDWQKDVVKNKIRRAINEQNGFDRIITKISSSRNRLAHVNLSTTLAGDHGYQFVRVRLEETEPNFPSSQRVLLVDHGIITKLPTFQLFACPDELIMLPVATALVSFPVGTSTAEGDRLLIRAIQQVRPNRFVSVQVWTESDRSLSTL